MLRANEREARKRDGAVSSVRLIRTPEEQIAATYMGPMDMAVDFDELAIRDYDDAAELEPNYLVRQGFGELVRRSGEGVPVSLSTPVRRVRYGGPGVVLETENGSVSARASSSPRQPEFCGLEGIDFDPALPDWKQAAIADVPMAMLAKIRCSRW